MNTVWSIVCDELFFVKHAFDLKIFSFVLMNNHFHLLASTPRQNLSEAMQFFLAQTGRRIPKVAGRINNTWARRFKRTEIQTNRYFFTAYKYVYRNPVEAGLVNKVEAYEFSTLAGIIGKTRLRIPLEEDTIFFSDIASDTLEWLNRKPKDEDLQSVRKALRRNIFKFPNQNGEKNTLDRKTVYY